MQKWQLPFPGYLSLGPPLQLIHWLPGLTFPLNIVTFLQVWFSKLMGCKDLEDKTCLLLGLGTSRDLGKGTQCTLKYISLRLLPSQMHFDFGVCGKCCSFQSGPILSHEHGHQGLLAWKQVPQRHIHGQGFVSSAHQPGLQQASLTMFEEGMKDLKLVISLFPQLYWLLLLLPE